MTRREDWLERMWAVIEDATAKADAFEYGQHDCCLFVALCVDEMTGESILNPLLERYHDKASALRFIAESGGFVQAVSAFLGPYEKGWPRRGDVTLVETEDGNGVGICVGREIAVAHDGVVFQPAEFTTVWRIG